MWVTFIIRPLFKNPLLLPHDRPNVHFVKPPVSPKNGKPNNARKLCNGNPMSVPGGNFKLVRFG